MADLREESKKLRVFFIPFFATGHIIPMADLAVLFSRCPNVDPTLCLTLANVAVLPSNLDPAVRVLLYPFPSEAAGLNPGQENISSVPADQEWKIHKAVDFSGTALRNLLHEHRPDAIVADLLFWSSTEIARELGVPLITLRPIGVFPQVVMKSLRKCRDETIGSAYSYVVVNDLPGPSIKMPISELPELACSKINSYLGEFWENIERAQLESHGTIVNTFYELEPAYCDHYRAMAARKRVWFVGPVALAAATKLEEKEKRHGHGCLSWLDGKEEGSVVFVCFGSWCHFKDEQLTEMAAGLERSGRSFLWVVRKSEGNDKYWTPDEGWEKRVAGRGMVVRGWAPQAAILGHKSVGAFLTHCGWNSVLESMAAGLPMLTWPLVFEQFINERLVIEVAGVGERAWNGFRSTKEEEKLVVPAEDIARAVSKFMEEEGSEGRRRMQARKYAAMAGAAVAEGGSSSNDLSRLIDELRMLRDNKLKEMQ